MYFPPSLNVHAVFLVRDPRGTMASRYKRKGFCMNYWDCRSAEVLCNDLVEDHKEATKLAVLFPGRFK